MKFQLTIENERASVKVDETGVEAAVTVPDGTISLSGTWEEIGEGVKAVIERLDPIPPVPKGLPFYRLHEAAVERLDN